MQKWMRLAAAFALMLGAATGALAQDPDNSTHVFLVDDIGLDPDVLGRMDAGEVIAQELDTDIDNEAAILGVVRIRATTEFFLRMYRDIERFETGWGVTKKISDPPVAADWEALELSEEDLDDLQKCELDDCGVQLGPESLGRLSALDWDRDDAGDAATRIIREQGHVAVTEYLKRGHEALGSYRYKDEALSVADEFEGLVASSPYILNYRPELHEWLHEYPNATLPGAEDFMYWSRMELGPKPIIRINHVTIYPTEEGVNGAVLIASKQLYFSHYFNVGLELNILEPDPEFPDDGFYLISLLRYRSESITGMFGGWVRGQAVGAGRVESRLLPPRGELDIVTDVGGDTDLQLRDGRIGIGSDPADQLRRARRRQQVTLEHHEAGMMVHDGLKRVGDIGIREQEDVLQEVCLGFQPACDCRTGDQDDGRGGHSGEWRGPVTNDGSD